MKLITLNVPASILPRGYYATHVIENGHEPGTLSGSELKGKARKYNIWYDKQRCRVSSILASRFSIRAGLYLHPKRRRWCRVWVDGKGRPVRLLVDEEA